MVSLHFILKLIFKAELKFYGNYLLIYYCFPGFPCSCIDGYQGQA